MSKWKSNIPKELDLDKNYSPAKTESQKERASIIAKETYAKEGTVWFDKMLERNRNKDKEWLTNISQTITEKQNQPEYLEHMSAQRLEAMDKPIDASGITLREKLRIANRKSAENPIHHANRTAANRKLKNDPKWREAHAKGVLVYSEECKTPSGNYPSMQKWMDENKKPGGRSFLKSLPHLFYLTKTGPGEETYERIYHTPFGKCASDWHAYELCKSNNESNAVKLRNIPGWWIKMAALYSDEYYISFEEAKYWPIEKDRLIGIDELETKPRIKKEKLHSAIQTWNKRIANQRTLYKGTK